MSLETVSLGYLNAIVMLTNHCVAASSMRILILEDVPVCKTIKNTKKVIKLK